MDLARLITIIRAKRRDMLTHSELRWVILEQLKMLVDAPRFEELLLAISPASDGVLLGSIIVHPDDGKPTDDFLLAAMELGFGQPADMLQRQVYEHFE